MNLSEKSWRQSILYASVTIKEVIENLSKSGTKIVLVLNERAELVGTISDGDIRSGLLKGLDLNSPITSVIHRNTLVVFILVT